MPNPLPDTRALLLGFELTRSVLGARTDDDALRLIEQASRAFTNATRVHLYALDAREKPVRILSTADQSPSLAEESVCQAALAAALDRHGKRVAARARPEGRESVPDTDDSSPLFTVAKVLADGDRVHALAVIVREGGRAFSEQEQRFFTILSLNAASGLARRRQRGGEVSPGAPASAEAGRDPAIAEEVKRVKTRRLEGKRDRFREPLYGILGESPEIAEVRELIHRYAPEKHPVLLLGESGTGKELVARALHLVSPRAKKPFLAVNAGALAANLVESELFGHVKGAFTGALQDQKGLFREAEGGTVFLDEIGELPLEMQPKLLRVLEQRAVKPVGATKEVPVDFRIVAGTNRDLRALVDAGKFRLDLFHRLNVLDLALPALRERRGDAAFLARAFLQESARGREGKTYAFSENAVRAIEQARWEGNIRELRNAVDRAVVRTRTGVIEPADLGLGGAPTRPALAPEDEARRQEIVDALLRHRGNRTQAALELAIHRSTLLKEMRRLGIAEDVSFD